MSYAWAIRCLRESADKKLISEHTYTLQLFIYHWRAHCTCSLQMTVMPLLFVLQTKFSLIQKKRRRASTGDCIPADTGFRTSRQVEQRQINYSVISIKMIWQNNFQLLWTPWESQVYQQHHHVATALLSLCFELQRQKNWFQISSAASRTPWTLSTGTIKKNKQTNR